MLIPATRQYALAAPELIVANPRTKPPNRLTPRAKKKMFGKRNKERWRGQPWQPRAEWGEEGRRSPEPRASARSGTRGTARRTKVGDGARTRHGEGRIFPTEIAAAPFELGAGSASSFRGKFTESFARALSAAATRSTRRGMSAPAHLDERRTAAPILPPQP